MDVDNSLNLLQYIVQALLRSLGAILQLLYARLRITKSFVLCFYVGSAQRFSIFPFDRNLASFLHRVKFDVVQIRSCIVTA